MKKFIEFSLGFGFWIVFMLLCGAAESKEWRWVVVFLILFGLICWKVNEVVKNKEDKEKNNNNPKFLFFRETIPANFLENVMETILKYPEDLLGFVQDELEVTNVYFAGRTLCIDVKDIDCDNDDWKGVITISNGTCGWFNPDGYVEGVEVKREELTQIEEDMYKEICKKNNINFE